MSPELIGRVCADVSIKAFNRCSLPEHVVMPTAIVTGETLEVYYGPSEDGGRFSGMWLWRFQVSSTACPTWTWRSWISSDG